MLTKFGKTAVQMAPIMNYYRRDGVQVVDCSGVTQYYFARATTDAWPSSGGSPFDVRIASLSSSSSAGIYVGSGTAEPTENDYTLTNLITSGLSGTYSFQYNDGFDANGNPHNKIVLSLTNTSGSDITVSEIGWVVKGTCYSSNKTSSSYTRNFLFDHTLLNTPVTIPAGESAAITYTIKVELPSS